MGRAIQMENRQDQFDRRLKLVEEALEELLQNGKRVHHVDLVEDVDVKIEDTEEEVETEEFLAPVVVKKKKKKKVDLSVKVDA
jgi:glutamyl-tRNA reductase